MSLSLFDPQSGAQVPPPRIVGGYEVSPPFKYPGIVSLQYNGRHSCGGSLWNGNTVITAAHCTIGTDAQWTVKVHRHDLSKPEEEEQGKTFKVIKRVKHPKYNATDSTSDVAIWKIDAPKGQRTNVELDSGSLGNKRDTLLTAIGWGTTSAGGTVSPKLLSVTLPVYDLKECTKAYGDYQLDVDAKTQLCAGFPEGQKDTCQGDSGGPLFAVRNGKQVLAGLTSWGIGCARPTLPGVYTRVSTFSSWIKKTVKDI